MVDTIKQVIECTLLYRVCSCVIIIINLVSIFACNFSTTSHALVNQDEGCYSACVNAYCSNVTKLHMHFNFLDLITN